jgi:hypothetical protein
MRFGRKIFKEEKKETRQFKKINKKKFNGRAWYLEQKQKALDLEIKLAKL